MTALLSLLGFSSYPQKYFSGFYSTSQEQNGFNHNRAFKDLGTLWFIFGILFLAGNLYSLQAYNTSNCSKMTDTQGHFFIARLADSLCMYSYSVWNFWVIVFGDDDKTRKSFAKTNLAGGLYVIRIMQEILEISHFLVSRWIRAENFNDLLQTKRNMASSVVTLNILVFI